MGSAPPIDTGARFGMLTVTGRAGSAGKRATWAVRCDCGAGFVAKGTHLRRGTTTHCGCRFALVGQLTGKRFGRLTVLGRAGSDSGRNATWHCQCDCGTARTAAGADLRSGNVRSCGCLLRDVTVARNMRHGLSDAPEYAIWAGMIQRCTNPARHNYARYGGAGVRVAQEWMGEDGFRRFFEHVGPRPSDTHSIDRVDPFGDYAPGNVRWATRSEQARNTRAAALKKERAA